MADSCRYIFQYLLLVFVIYRSSHAPCAVWDTWIGPEQLLFALVRLLPGGGGAQCIVVLWKESSHLRPSYHLGCHRRRSLIPTHFWLLLLAGDIELNLGPVKYPCTVCSRQVKSNQRGIFCDRCELWTHARGYGVDVVEYERLGLNVNEEWLCPACISAELPYADVSLISDANTSVSSCLPDTSCPDSNYPSTFEVNSCIQLVSHLNCQSLLPKMDEVRDILSNAMHPVILGISESWLDSSVADDEIDIPSYVLYRRNRGSRGGGILVYASSSCRSWRRHNLEDDTTEAIWIEVRLTKNPVLLYNIYRPPNVRHPFLGNLNSMLERAAIEGKELVLMGDLNCNVLTPNSCTNELLSITDEFHLSQLITVPTRITTQSQTTIDLLFSSLSELFSNTGTAVVAGSDHMLIYGERTERVKKIPQGIR